MMMMVMEREGKKSRMNALFFFFLFFFFFFRVPKRIRRPKTRAGLRVGVVDDTSSFRVINKTRERERERERERNGVTIWDSKKSLHFSP